LYKAPSQSDIVCFGEKENGRPRCSAAMASMVSVMTSMNLPALSHVAVHELAQDGLEVGRHCKSNLPSELFYGIV
jgi:hypothetical protein